ncbi:helix-turn-helix transcriptional regulator [Brachybacterium sp. GCM10030252]|uniref:helix-turn-helix transcriptional regulator n=1 Tax=Brachybacterium sp. GCM10030252 TaxID=3273380 RepID=UPI0036228071
MSAVPSTWRIALSTTVELPAHSPVAPRRSSLWLHVRSGAVSLGAGREARRLEAGDAAYLHHAQLHPATTLKPSTLQLADLRHLGPEPPRDPLIVPGFDRRQAGVLGLLAQCPLDGSTTVERPDVARAYGELIGAAMLSEARIDAGQSQGREREADPVVARVVARMAAAPCRSWTLTDLAASAHVGTTALVDRFRRATGHSPMQYLRRLRMGWAMGELAGSDAPISAIAHDAGYGSAEAFVRAFRAHTGTTPGRWRQTSRGRTLIEANPIAATAETTAPSAMAAAGPW